MGIFKKTLIFSSAISLILSPSAMASKRLSGAGASFPSKIYTRWFFDLAKSGGPRVNYQAVGSGSGRKAFIDETVNFGCLLYTSPSPRDSASSRMPSSA